MRPLNLKEKMSIAVFFLVVGLSFAISFLVSRCFESSFKESISTHQFTLVSSMAREIDDKLDMSRKLLKKTADLIHACACNDPEAIRNVLKNHKESLALFDEGLFFFAPDGTLLAHSFSHPHPEEHDYSFLASYRKTLSEGRSSVSIPYQSMEQTRHPAVMLTLPLFDSSGTLTGILAGSFDLLKNNFLGDFSQTTIGRTGYVYLFDSDRTLISHPDRSRVLERMPEGKNAGIEKALRGFEGSLENVNSLGGKGVSTFKRLQTTDWVMAAHFPLAEAYVPIQAMKTKLRYIFLVGIVLSMVVVRVVMGRLTTPLLRFTRHVAQLGDKTGDDRFFKGGTSPDEIGNLARAFNDMLVELDQKEADLLISQERYKTVSDFATDMAFWCDNQGHIRYISPYCHQLTGHTDLEFMADSQLIESIIYPDDMERWRVHQEQADHGHLPLEFRIVTKSGDIHWVAHVYRRIYDESGKPQGVRGSFYDIQERKIMEGVVIEQKELVESLLQNAGIPLFVLDTDHRVIAWNRACEELTGIKGDEIIGTQRHWSAFYDRERPCLADIILDSTLKQLDGLYPNHSASPLLAEGLQAEGWYPDLGGKDRYVCFEAAPVRNRTGRLVAAIETLRDLTPNKEAEERIADLRDYYLRLFKKSPFLIWRSGIDTKVDYVNDTWLDFTGRSFDEAIIDGLKGSVHPDDSEASLATYLEAFRSEKSFALEYRLRRYDGEYRWIIDNGRPFYDTDGVFVGYLGVCHDITERRQAEDQLRRLFDQVESGKKEWEKTFDCIGDIVIITDSAGRISRCNRALVELTGKNYSELLASNWWDYLPGSGVKKDNFVAHGREIYHEESERWFNFFFYPLKEDSPGSNGQMTGAIITLHDTTEIKQITEALELAYAELKEAQSQMLQGEKMASIGQLAAGVAHEINNPIGFITSNLGSLGKYMDKLSRFVVAQDEALAAPDPRQAGESLVTLRKNLKIDYVLDDIGQLIEESLDGAARVKKIVQDLKTFSRVDQAESQVVDLIECLESTLNIAWNELKYKVTVEKDYGEIQPVKCYPQQLNQVFLNLLVNAAHAIENQGTVRLRTWQENDHVCVSVSDTGCGIPEEVLPRIFEPFFTTKQVGKGTGLGLSISYDIVKKHGGEILVESELDRGTTFTIRLPANSNIR